MSFWNRRENIKNKPSVELRTSRVIEKVMNDFEVPMGVAIEKLMRTSGLYDEMVAKLVSIYPDFAE